MKYTGPLRQCIRTRYIGPTDKRVSRVRATADAGSVTLSWDSSLDTIDNHYKAALALLAKFGWQSSVVGGGLRNDGYYWVRID